MYPSGNGHNQTGCKKDEEASCSMEKDKTYGMKFEMV